MKTVVVPGASLMQVDVTAAGDLRLTCPGCKATRVYRGTGDREFPHADDDCPVLEQIAAAERVLRASLRPRQ